MAALVYNMSPACSPSSMLLYDTDNETGRYADWSKIMKVSEKHGKLLIPYMTATKYLLVDI